MVYSHLYVCVCFSPLLHEPHDWRDWLFWGWLSCPAVSIWNSLSLSQFKDVTLMVLLGENFFAFQEARGILGVKWQWISVLEAFIFLFQKAWGRSSSDLYFSYDWWFYLRALQSIVEYYIQQKNTTDTWVSNIVHPKNSYSNHPM